MNYKSFADLSNDIREWMKVLPYDFDLVVGIPRSGLLPASLIALYMNLPMTDIDGLLEQRILASGRRLNIIEKELFNKRDLEVLIIDDSVNSGNQIKKTKKTLETVKSIYKFTYMAVYVSSRGKKFVDGYYQVVRRPRCFEWNIFHHSILKKSCVDIDGILCRDPKKDENDDGPKYRKFIKNVKPYIIPTKKVGWLVSCRLEKYRKLTEEWLKKHNIKYDNLIMMNLPNKKTRQKLGDHAEYKAKIYNKTKASFFLESSTKQASEIAKISGKDVYCLEENIIYSPDLLKGVVVNTSEKFYRTINNPRNAIKKISEKLYWKLR